MDAATRLPLVLVSIILSFLPPIVYSEEETLVVDRDLYRTIEFIPRTVTSLFFTNDFNEPLRDGFPESVRTVSFGRDFNQSTCILSDVHTVEIRSNYIEPVLSLADNVSILFVGKLFSHNLQCIPNSIRILIFTGDRLIVPVNIQPSILAVIFMSRCEHRIRKFIRSLPSTVEFIGVTHHLHRSKFWRKYPKIHFIRF
jgi:hypothetical protein